MRRLRGRLSITTLSMTVTVLPMLLVGLILTMISTRSAQRLSEDLGVAMIRQTAERVGESVDDYLAHATRLSDTLAVGVENGSIRRTDVVQWQGRMIACLKGNPEVASIGYADASMGFYIYLVRLGGMYEMGIVGGGGGRGWGEIETVTISAAGQLREESRVRTPFHVEDRPWYRQAVTSSGPAWTGVHAWFIGAPVLAPEGGACGIAYVRALRDGEPFATSAASPPASRPWLPLEPAAAPRGFIPPADASIDGILAVDLDLEQVNGYLAEIAGPLGASLVISDASHRLIASSNPRLKNGWPDDDTDATPVERAIADRLRREGRAALAQRPQPAAPLQWAIDGRPFWVTEVPLPAGQTSQWNLLVAIPEQPEVLAARADIRHSIWIGVGYSVAAAGVSVFLARGLARPFRVLAGFARDVGDGQFDQRIDVATTREVAELSEALNQMAIGLRERVALLSAKDAALESSEVKARLIAHVSHEFRTPLNAIVGYADLLRVAAAADGRARDADDAATIIRASGQLLELVENLLELSRAEAGRIRLDVTAFRVGDLINEIAKTVRPAIERNGNTLHVEATADDAAVRVSTDPARLRQILINLLGNASQFTENGHVRLGARLAPDGTEVHFSVSDTGIGIEPAHMPNIFEPFMQIHRNRPGRRHEGAGLGLPIARQLTDLLGGQIRVVSQLGSGTTVTVSIPVESR